MNDPRKPRQRQATSHEPDDRPGPWILHLGLEVEAGRRPWLRPLVGATLMLGLPVLLQAIGDLDRAETPPDPDLVVITERLTSLATVLAFVLAGAFVCAGVAYWALCRYARRVWSRCPRTSGRS